MCRPCILKAGDKIAALAGREGDYEDWIAAGLGLARDAADVVAVHRGAPLPALDQVSAVVITGSGAMVTERLPWMRAVERWLADAVARGVPVLGICFGHQILAQALGGRVDYNPRGVEVGTVEVRLAPGAQAHPLFAGAPERFRAQASHRQSVLTLPPGAQLLASSDGDPHQAFAIGPCAAGVQFHPEFDEGIVRAYAQSYSARLHEEGKDPAAVLARSGPSPHAAAVLRRFAACAGLH
ncbi:MAG: glutamine amidotransferase [Thiohalomonadaceae bacterium]